MALNKKKIQAIYERKTTLIPSDQIISFEIFTLYVICFYSHLFLQKNLYIDMWKGEKPCFFLYAVLRLHSPPFYTSHIVSPYLSIIQHLFSTAFPLTQHTKRNTYIIAQKYVQTLTQTQKVYWRIYWFFKVPFRNGLV